MGPSDPPQQVSPAGAPPPPPPPPPAGAPPAGAPPAEEVVATRRGDVLLRHTILKSDHFPGCQNLALGPPLEGAPNFRQAPGLPVYGLAIPTARGARAALDALGAGRGRRRVLWHNMREEPVVYINGAPYVVREADKPFANLEYTGIDRARVEAMEARLKADVLAEAAQHGGQVLVAHEDDAFQVVEGWEPVSEVDVQTPLELYRELRDADGYDVDYARVPVTDEKAPKGDDFEALLRRCWAPPRGAALVFNCQMGRGRTTTGMVVGCLLHLRRALPGGWAAAAAGGAVGADLPPWFAAAFAGGGGGGGAGAGGPGAAAPASPRARRDAEARAGRFGVIRSLLRALEGGWAAKAALDAAVDACAAMQNLREAVDAYRRRVLYEPSDARREALLHVCLEYLERYYYLLAFSAYLSGPGFAPDQPGVHVPFAAWCAARPELASILARLLRANPIAALALDRAGGEEGDDDEGDEGRGPAAARRAEVAAIVAARAGSVLGPHTVLKQDHFPGCQSARLAADGAVPGAPNFRAAAPGLRVYGGGAPTAEGVREVLRRVGAAPGAADPAAGGPAAAPRCVWHMMREEPVVYLNGAPHVLREAARPFKNLLEYRGIGGARLEAMEARLAADARAEAARHGGRLLVVREDWRDGAGGGAAGGAAGDGAAAAGGGAQAQHPPQQAQQQAQAQQAAGRALRDDWEALDPGARASVQTPREVFDSLAAEGYRVSLVRVPLADGTPPAAADFDAFLEAAAGARPQDALVYTCQLGGGRTTLGTAIGALLRVYLGGGALPAASAAERGASAAHLDEDFGPGAGVGFGRFRGGGPRGASDDDDDAEDRDGPSDGDGDADADADGGAAPAPGSAAAAAAPATARRERYNVPGVTEGPPPPAPPARDSFGATPGRALAAAAAAAAPGGATPLPGGAAGAAGADPNNPDTPWDQEARNLRDGEYVAVRRFTRILERGADAKAAVDAALDAAGAVVNLRTAIMRYRRPKSVRRFFRPEMRARHTAFSRGAAYLERYCMLIAFAAYLDQRRRAARAGGGAAAPPPPGFEAWLAARPEVRAARDAIHANPAGALAPVPTVPPPTPAAARASAAAAAAAAAPPPPGGGAPPRAGAGAEVSAEEQRRVLLKRRGSTVGRRTILKSFSVAGERGAGGAAAAAAAAAALAGGPPPAVDLRRAAEGLPVYTLGHASADDLRALLRALGAGPPGGGGGAAAGGGARGHVVVTDLREEMVLYVNGAAYLRRELEMPAAALHHAGVRAAALEELERRLASDAAAEAAAWGGRLLLHREVASSRGTSGGGGGGAPAPAAAAPRRGDAGVIGGGAAEDITRTTEWQGAARVAAFWEPAPDARAFATPAELFAGLAAEGYALTYRRVPLSRERTPQASDLDQLAAQLAAAPAGAAAAGAASYLFLSRTAGGSSARFAAALAAAVLRLRSGADGRSVVGASPRGAPRASAPMPVGGSPAAAGGGGSSAGRSPAAGGGGGSFPGSWAASLGALAAGGSPPSASKSPAPKRQRPSAAAAAAAALAGGGGSADWGAARALAAGEYRGVMNLCRVLPGGAEAKAAVDDAVDAAAPVGSLRDDIFACKRAAEALGAGDGGDADGGGDGAPGGGAQAAAAARRLGLHYLLRYALLIAFRVYLEVGAGAGGDGGGGAGAPAPAPSFAEWFSERRELGHLLRTLDLE